MVGDHQGGAVRRYVLDPLHLDPEVLLVHRPQQRHQDLVGELLVVTEVVDVVVPGEAAAQAFVRQAPSLASEELERKVRHTLSDDAHKQYLQTYQAMAPAELDEAMMIDGAGAWRRYWNLALPLAKPALATCAIFTFLGSWDEFVWALTVINDPENRTLPIGIALFRGQWQVKKGALDDDRYEALVEDEVRPVFERLKKQCRDERIQPRPPWKITSHQV